MPFSKQAGVEGTAQPGSGRRSTVGAIPFLYQDHFSDKRILPSSAAVAVIGHAGGVGIRIPFFTIGSFL
jgi:hypothetical protein